MGKGKLGEDSNTKYNGLNTIIKEGKSLYEEIEKGIKEKKVEEIKLTFKGNRKKDLRIGKTVYEFMGPCSLNVPKSILNHPDFENQKKYFLIREV